MSNNTTQAGEGNDGNNNSNSLDLTQPAMKFLLLRLPELGIEIDNGLDLHMDQVA